MRTTVDISDDLMRRAKQKAAAEGVPLRDVVEAALRDYLSGRPRGSGYKLRWATEKGALASGLDLDDRDSLFDVMDGIQK
jgi:Arc/MetJ family transcription regulator